ncbi:uncharacterized protein LOC132273511 [Cornus florida]|uniref:uncharacterized protein LOC132273511 n=1 Tax=Cornus florida TaxID=4283 RepID=UPI00289A6CA5|nr:uncharacterized protein LOC132273511 [Cornus florida]
MEGKPKEDKILGQAVNCCLARLKAYLAELLLERTADASTSFSTNVLEIREDTEDKLDAIQLTDLKAAPMKLDDLKAEVQDPLLELNLGTEQDPRPTYISKLLEPTFREELISLLHEYKDYFAWTYEEMPGLSRELVEHKLPIKEGFKPFKQPLRRMSQEMVLKVKEEIKRLHKAGFIRTARYVDWISNIVPVIKKNGKLRVCVDLWNINLITSKDEYPMPVADKLVDSTANNEILSFMDGHSRYNQIYIAKEDIAKTAFRCPRSIGTFEWVIMPFGLKNVEATYQKAMNSIFYYMIGHFLEVYIDDVVIKSSVKGQHLHNLKMAFERMRQHKLKMNPLKCAFGVSVGNFLGFLVYQRGIEIDQNKAKAIIEAKPPTTKKELQRFLGQVGYLRRFIANHTGKTHAFSPLLKSKGAEEFKWTEQHQHAFEGLKSYLANPPVMMPLIKKRPLRLYLSIADESIGTLLAQNNEWGNEQAIYYLSRVLTPVECRYTSIEKLYLFLYYAAMNLRNYMLPVAVYIISQTNLIKYMLLSPLITGSIGKWLLVLMEFSFKYIPQKAVKGRAMAELLVDHPSTKIDSEVCDEVDNLYLDYTPWTLMFDRSSTRDGGGAGIVIISPKGRKTTFSFFLDFKCIKNQAEYEALIIGLEILLELKVDKVQIIGDSNLILSQLSEEYRYLNWHLRPFHSLALELLCQFDDFQLKYWPRHLNTEADDLAQLASRVKVPPGVEETLIKIKRRTLPSIDSRCEMAGHFQADKLERIKPAKKTWEIFNIDIDGIDLDDWKTPIIYFLQNPNANVDKRIQLLAPYYILIDGDLYKKSKDGLLLRYLGRNESMRVIAKSHLGICGAHQAGIKMRWLLRRGWALGFIGKLRPPSADGHTYMVVATDYFIKWVEAIPLKIYEQSIVINFIKKHIIHRFGIPETLTIDKSLSFVGSEVIDYCAKCGVQVISFTPYFAQVNEQAEASNKVILNILEKMIENHPKDKGVSSFAF